MNTYIPQIGDAVLIRSYEEASFLYGILYKEVERYGVPPEKQFYIFWSDDSTTVNTIPQIQIWRTDYIRTLNENL